MVGVLYMEYMLRQCELHGMVDVLYMEYMLTYL